MSDSQIPCPSCDHANRQEARFCDGCGAALARACSSCGTSLRPAARFCDGCGSQVSEAVTAPAPREPRTYTPKHLAEKILTSRSALEGERKHVTVLFADVKGSMELAERLDPEEWHRILDRFLQLLTESVHRFEGTVNQYTGDGIMALFGAPIAHEDHAQRACWAALHLKDALRAYAQEVKREHGLTVSIRTGLNSGEVVVGRIGDDLRMDYTAQGHVVGLAQRMEQLADPGSIYLTERTAALVKGYFRLRDLGPFTVKGVSEPIHVRELEGVGALRTRLDVSRARGLTRFVGRDDDLRTLEAALARAREGNGQVVGVVGEAGVGKSRLCFEFAERCRARGLRVLEGRAVAHGKNIPFLPILQAFRAYYGISEQDDDRTVREKIAGRLLLIDESFREVLPLVFDFLGATDPRRPPDEMDPELRQRQLFGVLRRVVQHGAEGEITVTLLEDLHWFDAGSEAWLAQWVDAIAGGRGMLLVNFRPDYHAEWMRKSYYQQVALAPLGPEAVRELLGDLLGTDPSVGDLAAAIHVRTGGNPFFAEEIVQSLIESGHLQGTRGAYRLATRVDQLAVPGTVQAVLAARIDRLPEREKQVLQTAAVIGKDFAEPILAAVAELPGPELAAALRALAAAEFVYQEALYPVAEYAFRHPLTREVAYGSQLGDRRRRTHAAVARAVEAAHRDKLEEQAAVLAHHWEEAGEPLVGARWHRRAAERMLRDDVAAAYGHSRRVCELVADGPESAEAVELALGARVVMLQGAWRLGVPQEEWQRIFAAGREIAERAHDPRRLGWLYQAYSVCQGNVGDEEETCRAAREAARLGEETDDRQLALAAALPLALGLGRMERIEEGIAAATRAIDLETFEASPRDPWSPSHRYPARAHLLGLRGILRCRRGQLADGMAELDRAVQLARERSVPEGLGWILVHVVWGAYHLGDGQMALSHARQVVEIAERLGLPALAGSAYGSLAVAHLVAGAWRDSADTCERLLADGGPADPLLRTTYLPYLAEAYVGMGDGARARRTAEEALTCVRQSGARAHEVPARLARVRALLMTEGVGARDEVEREIEAAAAFVAESGARAREPFVVLARGELARAGGDEAGRVRQLRAAHRLFAEMGAPLRAEQVAKELGA